MDEGLIEMHAALAILIRTKEGKQEVLLQHRSATAKKMRGLWGLFGGRLEVGEPAEHALRRELLEELEFEVGECFPYYKRYAEVDGYAGTLHAFIVLVDAGVNLVQHEGQGMEWVDMDAIDFEKHPTHESHRQALEAGIAYYRSRLIA